MKKLIAILMFASIPALAGDYSKAVKMQKECEGWGEASQNGAKARDSKISLKKLHKTIGQEYDGSQYSTLFYDAYYSKDTPKNAYMASWAECMDFMKSLENY